MIKHLYDTHFHLDLMESYDSIVEYIDKNQIYTIAVTNLPALYMNLKNKLNCKFIRPALGFHPELLNDYKKHIPEMWKLLGDTKYIGEVGLDYKIGKEFKELQTKFFEELVIRCNELGGKILTVHSRQSADDIVSIVGLNFKGKIIMHWYSGNKSTLSKALNNGYYFSVNYAMLNSKNGVDIINSIPEEKLLLETDGPFINFNNKPFSPHFISQIIIKLSQLKNVDRGQMHSILWNNFKSLLV